MSADTKPAGPLWSYWTGTCDAICHLNGSALLGQLGKAAPVGMMQRTHVQSVDVNGHMGLLFFSVSIKLLSSFRR